ncbi:MFS transporter [Leifsonia sp. 21MFCrub1.1]|uniref:MFS transporter n=1 Tax=Leifsonia sp. 21MFCrub1.1 TaxID=1798223 RepID=UPI00089284D0|nr:MFS transporter [Leifsonia sp. 21MFCrub1.1]SEB01220.1 Predicted arabinose efflux permease, MFS family [Leifsonia sp. 21MFCrub1.1]
MTFIEQSYRRSLPALLVLALALFVVGTNAFVIAGLLPRVGEGIGATATQVSWSITTYSLVVAVAAPAVSVLLPRVPRATLMAAGLAVFAVGTAASALAPNLPLFIAGRTFSGLGGAALVPTATAAAASLARPGKRGQALAIVGAGFTLATAVGSPLGTALGGVAGWRFALWCIVGIAVVLVVAIPLVVRGVPVPPAVSLRRRLAPLADLRIVAPLATTLLMVAGFNIVYIFSAAVTHASTGGSGSLLAILLLAYGVAGVAGNSVAGPLTDRFGSRIVAVVALAGQALTLVVLAFTEASFVASVVVFALWGVAAFAIAIPVQHRLVHVDPESSALALSWYSTAMYVGIAIAPPIGTLALAAGGAVAVPLAGSAVTVGALAVFVVGYLARAPRPLTA